jgi:uncharacterized membrane protein YfcA
MAIVFGALVGLVLGLTAGGGSVLAVPLLIYGLGLSAQLAVPAALTAVALVAAIGASDGARARLLDVRPGLAVAGGGIVGAPTGVLLAGDLTEADFVLGFAMVTAVAGLYLGWRAGLRPGEADAVRAGLLLPGGRGDGKAADRRHVADGSRAPGLSGTVALVATGLGAGLLAGLLGVGAGFLIVPALMAVTRMQAHRAVATSLLAITLTGLAGAAAAYAAGRGIPWFLVGLFVIGAVAGMGVARRLAAPLAGPRLQWLFALAVIALAAAMLADPWLGWLSQASPQ